MCLVVVVFVWKKLTTTRRKQTMSLSLSLARFTWWTYMFLDSCSYHISNRCERVNVVKTCHAWSPRATCLLARVWWWTIPAMCNCFHVSFIFRWFVLLHRCVVCEFLSFCFESNWIDSTRIVLCRSPSKRLRTFVNPL